MQIEVVFAEAERQRVCAFELPADAVVADALKLASAHAEFAGVEINAHAVGIFGQLCEPDRRLADGDRVEIYRELQVDAKEARRRRAQDQHKSQDKSRKKNP